MRKYPELNKESQLRIWLNKNELTVLTKEQFILLEESEYCEVTTRPGLWLYPPYDALSVNVEFKPRTKANKKYAGSYHFRIRERDIL